MDRLSFRVDDDISEWLDKNVDNKSKFVRDLIKKEISDDSDGSDSGSFDFELPDNRRLRKVFEVMLELKYFDNRGRAYVNVEEASSKIPQKVNSYDKKTVKNAFRKLDRLGFISGGYPKIYLEKGVNSSGKN